MKKSKLSITLVTSFIAAMALTACDNSVTSSKKAIVTFTPYDSKETIDLITDDVYKEFTKTSAGVSKFYDKILEVLIRYEFKEKGFKGEMDYSEIEKWAKNQVQEQKDKAKASAESNGTNYDDEWKSILDSNSVDDANELREKFIYEKEKEVIKNWYAGDTNKAEELKAEFIGLDATGEKVNSKVSSAMPYHVRHILVKVDEASESQEKFYKGTISETQAKLLYDTVSTLAEGKYTFAQVAKDYSEDGSASSGGDVGIMTNTATSGSLGMVNEFQLGLYAYDNLYDTTRKGDEVVGTIKNELGITEDVKNALPASFAEVPYEAFVKIGQYAKVTADKYGNKLANGSATVYPRNILWNKYLNMHNVFLIKKSEVGAPTFDNIQQPVNPGDPVIHTVANPNEEFSTLIGADYAGADAVHYQQNKTTGFNDAGYLVDEKGNMIIGVRSEYGIHLMVIEKSMHEFATLADYYTTKIPGDTGYPAGDTYVSYIVSQSKEDYKKRADDVKNKITSFDSTYDYRLYQWLQTQVAFTFTEAAAGLDEKIDAYINNQIASNRNKQEEGLAKVWKTYTRMLDVQDYNRNDANWITVSPVDGSESPRLTRLASEQIANDFYSLYTYKAADGVTDLDSDDLEALYVKFAEGGDYYYYA